jgi:hypothetical protein
VAILLEDIDGKVQATIEAVSARAVKRLTACAS